MARQSSCVPTKLIEGVLQGSLVWKTLDEVLADGSTTSLVELSSLSVSFSFVVGAAHNLRSSLGTSHHVLVHRLVLVGLAQVFLRGCVLDLRQAEILILLCHWLLSGERAKVASASLSAFSHNR